MQPAASAGTSRSRLANVAGVLLVPRGADSSGERDREWLAEELATIFDETLVARDDGAEDPLGLFVASDAGRHVVEGVAAVLGGAEAERVLVVMDGAPRERPDLWLALTAWPEAAAIVLQEAGRFVGAIYRRDEVARAARAMLAEASADGVSLDGLHDHVGAHRVTTSDLGLAPIPVGGC